MHPTGDLGVNDKKLNCTSFKNSIVSVRGLENKRGEGYMIGLCIVAVRGATGSQPPS